MSDEKMPEWESRFRLIAVNKKLPREMREDFLAMLAELERLRKENAEIKGMKQ